MTKKTITFEAAMERLEEITRLLESGTEGLDESLKLYEEACISRKHENLIGRVEKPLRYHLFRFLLVVCQYRVHNDTIVSRFS